METDRVYALVYLWQGDRHRHLTNGSLTIMEPLVNEMRRRGWQAWLEVVGEADCAGRSLFTMDDD